MEIRVVDKRIELADIARLAEAGFGEFVKAVVDVELTVMAIGGELHSDEEATLLERGSRQADLWGINLYPAAARAEWIEFDSMINLRPSQGNRTRGVEDAELRRRIVDVVDRLVG